MSDQKELEIISIKNIKKGGAARSDETMPNFHDRFVRARGMVIWIWSLL